jgi:hypothetical protein
MDGYSYPAAIVHAVQHGRTADTFGYTRPAAANCDPHPAADGYEHPAASAHGYPAAAYGNAGAAANRYATAAAHGYRRRSVSFSLGGCKSLEDSAQP